MTLAQIACLLGLAAPSDAKLNDVLFPVRQYRRSDVAFRAGGTFRSLFAVVHGRFKVVSLQPSGHEQVVGVLLPGDFAGLEAAEQGVHRTSLVALESSRLVIVPLTTLRGLAREYREVEALMYRAFHQEIDRGFAMLGLLGTANAKAGVAAFVVSLAERFACCSAPAERLTLPLSRLEIAQLLGTTQETVCRAFSSLRSSRLIRVMGHRTVSIDDLDGLREVAQSSGREGFGRPARSASRVSSTVRAPDRHLRAAAPDLHWLLSRETSNAAR